MRGIISILVSSTCSSALFAASFLPAPAVKQMITNEIATSYSTHSFSQAVNKVVVIPESEPSQTTSNTELLAMPEFTNAVNNVVHDQISNSVDHAIHDKVLTDWVFSPPGNYEITQDEPVEVDGQVVITFTLKSDGEDECPNEEWLEAPASADDVTFIHFGNDVIARRKWVSSSGIALLEDVQGMVGDNMSIGTNALGELEIKGFSEVNAYVTNGAVFVKLTGGAYGWLNFSDLIDTNTLYVSTDGRICAKDYSRRHPWAWCPENRQFTNCVVQLTRTIVNPSYASAVEYLYSNNTVVEQSSVSPLPMTGVYFVTVYHETRGTRLNVITMSGATKEEIVSLRGNVPQGDENHSNFYVATIFEDEQVDGLYAMPTCFLWE